jgi:hypothetical protein
MRAPIDKKKTGPRWMQEPPTHVDEEPTIKTEFTLFQNYPNPFNPETVISWQLAVSSYITLKVYDVLGNEVATLVDEYQQAGTYNSKLTTQNFPLSSGVYFYRLSAGSKSITKKLILIR